MRIVVVVRDKELLGFLGGFSSRLAERLVYALTRVSIALQSRVKEKLSDDVLHVRTGTLRRSINQHVEQMEYGVTATVGTNVEYAAAHEYGFTGIVTVKAHLRHLRTAGKMSKASKWRRGKLTGETAQVSAHERMMNLPERSFLRTALIEMGPYARDEIRQAVLGALKS